MSSFLGRFIRSPLNLHNLHKGASKTRFSRNTHSLHSTRTINSGPLRLQVIFLSLLFFFSSIESTVSTSTVAFNSLPMSIYAIRSSSSLSSTILRGSWKNSRGDAMILRSLSSNSGKSCLSSGSDIPLTQRLASLLIDIPLHSSKNSDSNSRDISNTESDNNNAGIRASLAIAGGGSKALSALASTPGASSILIDASLLYDRKSFLSFISSHPLPPDPIIPPFQHPSFGSYIRKEIDTDGSNTDDNDSGNEHQRMAKFNFVSDEAALLLSNSALRKSLLLSSSLSKMNQVVGVGCTSSLISIPKKRMDQYGNESVREERKSRAHLCLSFPDGMIRSYSLIMGTGISVDSTVTANTGKRRTRSEEEEVLANFILWTLVQEQERRHSVAAAEVNDYLRSDSNKNDGDAFDLGILSLEQGDVLAIQEWSCSMIHPARRGSSSDDIDIHQDMESILQQKAQEIISSNNIKKNKITIVQADPVLLVPGIAMQQGGSGNNRADSNTRTQMSPLVHTVLPPNPIIFPGSFNPPHMGHVALARAAVKAMSEKYRLELDEWFQEGEERSDDALSEDREGLLESIWNTMEHQAMVKQQQKEQLDNSPFSILFEMSLINADKPPMEANEAARRVALFAKYHDSSEKFVRCDKTNGSNTTAMPSNWGVILTSAPLFLDKVRLLQKYLAQESSLSFDHLPISMKKLLTGRGRIITFVIGTDTLVRILNPKYYNQDREQMLEAVREMGREGVHFVVGGRLEQIQPHEGKEKTRFVTGEDELIDLPPDVREMFTIIQEKDFRLDISSSELRARM